MWNRNSEASVCFQKSCLVFSQKAQSFFGFLAKEELSFGNEPVIHLMKYHSSNNNQHQVGD